MKDDEVEYECNYCGTTVDADTKVCPNCGNTLETEELSFEFEDLKLDLNPVDFSIVESLFKENGIEYFVKKDALDTVFGVTAGHSSKFSVRQDHIERAEEIIKSFQESIKEEYECPNCGTIVNAILEKCPDCGNTLELVEPTDKEETEKIQGVEGWLLFLCFYLVVLLPIWFVSDFFLDYFQSRNELESGSFLKIILDIDLVVSVFLIIYGIYAGLKLWKIKPMAVTIANRFFNVLLLYTAAIFIVFVAGPLSSDISYNLLTQLIFRDIWRDAIGTVLFIIIWKSYLKNSDRVKNTYDS